jgi:hypothetical protein
MDEFKFPDEIEQDQKVEVNAEGSDVVIDIVDDAPPEDRNRKPLAHDPEDANDEELAQYSSNVQRRIKELSHARHDERRAKEAALREREELERYASQLVNENNRLKKYVQDGEQVYAGTLKSAAEAELEIAKKKFKDAHESFDADAIIEAQQALTSAQMKLERASSFRPTTLQQEETVVQPQRIEQAPPQVDEKTQRWQARNTWFGPDDEMTAVALVAHKQLVASGVDPRSDEYFAQIDARMRKRFPDRFEGTRSQSEPQQRKAANVVAPASRTTGAKKVTLSTSQVAIAKRLGVPLEVYAKQVALQEAQ